MPTYYIKVVGLDYDTISEIVDDIEDYVNVENTYVFTEDKIIEVE